jgi:hypothetical protein
VFCPASEKSGMNGDGVGVSVGTTVAVGTGVGVFWVSVDEAAPVGAEVGALYKSFDEAAPEEPRQPVKIREAPISSTVINAADFIEMKIFFAIFPSLSCLYYTKPALLCLS